MGTSRCCGSPAGTRRPTTRNRSASTSSGRSTILLTGTHDRFASEGERLAAALRGLGVDARVARCRASTARARTASTRAARERSAPRSGSCAGGVRRVGGRRRWCEHPGVLRDVYSALDFEWEESTAGAGRGGPGLTPRNAVEAALTSVRRPRAGGPGRGHPRPGPPAGITARTTTIGRSQGRPARGSARSL